MGYDFFHIRSSPCHIFYYSLVWFKCAYFMCIYVTLCEIKYHNVFSLEVIVILMSLNYGRPDELGKRLPWIKWSLSVTSSQLDVLSTQYFKTPKWNSSSPAQWSVNKATRMPDICKMYPVIRKHDSFWAVVILVKTTVSSFYELYVLLAILITIHHQNKARFGRYCIYILNSAF